MGIKFYLIGSLLTIRGVMSKIKYILFGVVLFSFVGCASTIMSDNRHNLMKLSAGISKEEVYTIMGKETKIFLGGSVDNPYRTEMYRSQGHRFELLFYVSQPMHADGMWTDDELMPIVIMDGKLDGWGWSYWNDVISKYELRIK